MRSERGRPALVASARARCPRSQEKCEHLPGAKQLTRDIYDRIIQMCENRRCVYKPLLPPSLHENLTWLILVSYSSSQIH
jgi:hypothetical protein